MVAIAADPAPEIEIGEFIYRVIDGEDFAGRDIVLSGVVLSMSESGLLNLGTSETYLSGSYTNFASVYETDVAIPKGRSVKILINVEESSSMKLGAEDFVTISAKFRTCLVC